MYVKIYIESKGPFKFIAYIKCGVIHQLIENHHIHFLSVVQDEPIVPLMLRLLLCSWSHSGVVGAAGEVPGWSEETQPARGRTCAAHGHLPALPRYWLCVYLCVHGVVVFAAGPLKVGHQTSNNAMSSKYTSIQLINMFVLVLILLLN